MNSGESARLNLPMVERDQISSHACFLSMYVKDWLPLRRAPGAGEREGGIIKLKMDS